MIRHLLVVVGEKMDKRELAVQYKHSGCNCCQAVLKAYKDELKVPEELLMKMGSGFGTGMGCLEATCGALCAATMVAGLKNDATTPTVMMSKKMLASFKEKSGATICKELKGVETGKVLCDCDDCVRHAVECIEETKEQMC